MNKKWLLALGMVSVLTVVGLSGCSQGDSVFSAAPSELRVSLNNQQEGIWVSGTGKVSAVPDIAFLRLGIEAQDASVADAQAQAAEAMNAVMTALTASGVAEKDIQTQYFNIQRVTRWDEDKGQEVLLGYRVSNMVVAKIRDMEKVGAIIDAAASAGGDLTRIDSVSFSIEEPSAYQVEARQRAMTDAAAKAKQMAELAGVKLGKATYISENAYIPYPVYRQDLFEKVAGAPVVETPISPGELEVSVNVQVAYAILN